MNLNYKYGDCYFTFHPVYIMIQDLVAYMIPMLAILLITCYILHRLHQSKSFNKQSLTTRNRRLLMKKIDSVNSEHKIKLANNELTEINYEVKANTKINFLTVDESINKPNETLIKNSIKNELDLSRFLKNVKINANFKLCVILTIFCILWLPFCILWPFNAICFNCVSDLVYQISYWMGYAQSLINPILLLILTKPVSDKRSESSYYNQSS